jgi:hypothetical protein
MTSAALLEDPVVMFADRVVLLLGDRAVAERNRLLGGSLEDCQRGNARSGNRLNDLDSRGACADDADFFVGEIWMCWPVSCVEGESLEVGKALDVRQGGTSLWACCCDEKSRIVGLAGGVFDEPGSRMFLEVCRGHSGVELHVLA